MPSLAIQEIVKGKLLNVEAAVLAILVVLLLTYVHLLLAGTILHFKKLLAEAFFEDLNLSVCLFRF